MIIDAHSHLGWSKIFNAGVTDDVLIGTMDANKIQATVAMPAAGADPTQTHDAIARLAERHPHRVFGMVSMTPLIGEDAYRREFWRCVREMRFVAVKIHTVAHAVAPNLPVCDMIFELAQEANIPVMVHTGLGAPFALPSLVIPRARQYPKLPIILAHAGFAIYSAEALIVAQECPNVYLEPSWCVTGDIKRMVATVGATRVMYGGDLPSNVPVELVKYATMGLSADDYRMCVGGSAMALFRLPITQQ